MSHCKKAACGEKGPPNVVLIISDDQGWGDIGSHGNDKIETPVLDRLAEEGARFERFFVSPVCAPTRASLLTGRYYLRTGTHGVTRGAENMRPEEVTLGEVFQAAGYRTGCFGKWHNGAHYPYHPNGQGFDEFFGFCAGHWNNYFGTVLERNGTPVRTEGYITDVLTDAAMEFIENSADEPWLCYVPYNAPHSPWQVPDKYFERAKGRGLDDKTACAYAMVENIDHNVGRLLDRLEEVGQADNTLVLFLTDNGPNSDRYNGNMRGRKGSVHEGGVRVPLFVRWPGRIAAGTKIEPIAAHIDLLPTLAELCEVKLPEDLRLDGKSLAPLLLGKSPSWPDRMLFAFRSSRRGVHQARGAVRTQQWRAVKERGGWQLFDMQADPSQKKNVAAQHAGVVKRLSSAFAETYTDVTRRGFKPLPIPIGHDERRKVVLPGHEAFLQPARGKGIRYVGPSGWANDWITGWTGTAAYPQWEVDVVQEGTYSITLRYNCDPENAGAKIRVSVGDKSLDGKVDRPYVSEMIDHPDRIPRKEVYERTWGRLSLGGIQLPAGRTQLRVRALSKRGREVMELKAVEVERAE